MVKQTEGEGKFLPVSCAFLFAVSVLTYIYIYISPSYGILSFMDAEQLPLSAFRSPTVFLMPRVKGTCRMTAKFDR